MRTIDQHVQWINAESRRYENAKNQMEQAAKRRALAVAAALDEGLRPSSLAVQLGITHSRVTQLGKEGRAIRKARDE